MNISITMTDFPAKAMPMLKEDFKSQSIKVTIQERPTGTVFSCTTDDVTKAQIFTILLDKYRFMEGGDECGEEEEAPL